MERKDIDLKKEQKASLNRGRFAYSAIAKIFFATMDLVTGPTTTLAKTKLIEMLASIPYREWEFRQYIRMTRCYTIRDRVEMARRIADWGRDAQDNEYWHLRVINQKMMEENQKDPWFLSFPVTFLLVLSYSIFARFLALANIKRAFLFNAEFEDHAEHVYAQFVEDHPEWETQAVTGDIVSEYIDASNWADVFRRIGLDERDHMNKSFYYCGKPEHVVKYDGMPDYQAN